MAIKLLVISLLKGFPGGSDGKESTYNAGDLSSVPGSGRIPWRREWLTNPVFLPAEFNGQRSLMGYSPQGHKKLNITQLLTHTHNFNIHGINSNDTFIISDICNLSSLFLG